MEYSTLLFYFLLPLVAFLYASVGHGGASGYLALMALFSFSPSLMKPTALVLNILVSLLAFYQYKKTVQMNWRLFGLLVVGSIPAAFVGGSIQIDAQVYKQILGAFLFLSVIRLLGFYQLKESVKKEISIPLVLVLGVCIGFISGLIGIGGGIILSPILLLLGWSNLKETSAISALFITVNSIAGIAGTKQTGINWSSELYIYIFIVLAFIGGLLGSYFGAHKFNLKTLRLLLALVLSLASAKLLFS